MGTTGIEMGPRWTVGVNIPQDESLICILIPEKRKNDVSEFPNDAFKYPVNLKTTVQIIHTSYICKRWNT